MPVNPLLSRLQAYPFEKLRSLFQGVVPNPEYSPIRLEMGEPQHPVPHFVAQILQDHIGQLGHYPATLGIAKLRETIAAWLCWRYQLPNINPDTQVLPVNGSREALFALAQTVLDPQSPDSYVLMPNPGYQIYEGACLLAGAKPYYLPTIAENNFIPDYRNIPETVWQKTRLLYVCSPGNPSGAVHTLSDWQFLFETAKRYNFVIASDECYSEIYQQTPPLGALQAAIQLGNADFENLIVLSSLSKRSNLPGLRSGFVAGEAKLLKAFLLYRTYHGSAMSPLVQQVSIAAWQDEEHVKENRKEYQGKYAAVVPLLKEVFDVSVPEASFYLWLKLPNAVNDTDYAKCLYQQTHITVLPGSFLGRAFSGTTPAENPSQNWIRIALVPTLDVCIQAAERIVSFTQKSLVIPARV